jgi:hypothetical protein
MLLEFFGTAKSADIAHLHFLTRLQRGIEVDL